jgi:hypothetical protein
MNAVSVCRGQGETAHLNRFFLRSLVDAQGAHKLQRIASRAANTRNLRSVREFRRALDVSSATPHSPL